MEGNICMYTYTYIFLIHTHTHTVKMSQTLREFVWWNNWKLHIIPDDMGEGLLDPPPCSQRSGRGRCSFSVHWLEEGWVGESQWCSSPGPSAGLSWGGPSTADFPEGIYCPVLWPRRTSGPPCAPQFHLRRVGLAGVSDSLVHCLQIMPLWLHEGAVTLAKR